MPVYPRLKSSIEKLYRRVFYLVLVAFAVLHVASAAQAQSFAAPTNSNQLSGLWWNASESGWGISLAHQGPVIFAAWFSYDLSGKPTWYVMSNCAISGASCAGDLYRVTGATPPTVPWNGNNRVVSRVGSGTITFADLNTATMRMTINAQETTRSITRQILATSGATPLVDRTGLWWNADESGWGISVTQQFDVIFAAWYAYDASGEPVWYVASNCAVSGNSCSGDLYKVLGGAAATSAWDGSKLQVTKVGTLTMNFSGAGPSATGSMSYSIDGQSSSRTLSRQIFYAGSLVPDAPVISSVAAGDARATISFFPPAYDGGSAVTGFRATCSTGASSTSATGPSSPIVVTGLQNGSSYRCTVSATNAVGTSPSAIPASVSPTSAPVFTLTSAAAPNGGTLPADYTCDGMGSTPQLSWTNAPAGTREFVVLLTTLPGDGSIKWNWVLHSIPSGVTTLARDSFGMGTLGIGSDGPVIGYQSPCSQGPGAKQYTFTVYALSASPVLPSAANQVTGAVVTNAIRDRTLASASLTVNYARNFSGSSSACQLIRSSLGASTTGTASVGCDATYAYISSAALPTHTMMNGIRATNLQVPTAQNFFGTNAWRIPLAPAIANTTTTAVDGPIGVAVNGVPIFNPCKQGGCQNGDTKVLGELDICNGHAGRADDYHYHAAPTCMMSGKPASYWDTHPIGWALDGFAIFGYNNADGSVATRDNICGGNTLPVQNAPQGYSYHVTDTSPYVLSCFRGTPSPDLAGQSSKYSPMRQPPVQPFAVSNMTLSTDPSDGYQVLQFTSAINFTTNETGNDSYPNPPGTYRIRYKQLTGAALVAALASSQSRNRNVCWNFQFVSATGADTQPTVTYCR